MESGLEDRNNPDDHDPLAVVQGVSQWSPA